MLAEWWGTSAALGVTSVVFGLVHLQNAGATVGVGVRRGARGLFLGAVLVATRSLWAAFAAHVAWNWVLAGVLHSAVSGIPFATPDYRVVDAGPDWATGGVWGPRVGCPPPSVCCRSRSTSTRGARAARSHSMTDRVAVIGAGQMGNGIAHVFAQAGIPVTMIDVSEDALRRGRATIEKNMDRQVKKNTLSARRQAGRVRPHRDEHRPAAAVGDATLVVEAATENTDLKFRIFADLDRIAARGRDPRDQHELDLDHRDRARSTKRAELR